jgi:hypothetical protein
MIFGCIYHPERGSQCNVQGSMTPRCLQKPCQSAGTAPMLAAHRHWQCFDSTALRRHFLDSRICFTGTCFTATLTCIPRNMAMHGCVPHCHNSACMHFVIQYDESKSFKAPDHSSHMPTPEPLRSCCIPSFTKAQYECTCKTLTMVAFTERCMETGIMIGMVDNGNSTST